MRSSVLIIPALILIVNFGFIFNFLAAQPSNGANSSLHVPDTSSSSKGQTIQIVVQFEMGDTLIERVSIHPGLSGLQALESTGLDIDIKDFGDGSFAVCSIEAVGCPADDCFCDQEKFWNYEYWDGSTWMSYQIGASDSSLTGGETEGWRWGEFDADKLPPLQEILDQE